MPIPTLLPPLLTAIGAGLSGIAGIGGSIFNTAQQKKSQAHNQRVQEVTWDREDNAVQRRVADLAAAGLHPTLAAGSAADTSAPIRQEPVQMDRGMQDGFSVLASQGQALANIEQTQAQTDLTRAQVNAYELEVEGKRLSNQRVAQLMKQTEIEMKRLDSVLANMEHDYDYARRHDLPIGQIYDRQIRRIEIAIDKMFQVGQELGDKMFPPGGVIDTIYQDAYRNQTTSFFDRHPDPAQDTWKQRIDRKFFEWMQRLDRRKEVRDYQDRVESQRIRR